MREILFRGKRKDNGEWLYGFYWDDTTGHHYIQRAEPPSVVCFEVDPKTIGQYTGLEDKADVKIFEGDIVKTKDLIGKKRTGEIIFDNELNHALFCLVYKNEKYGLEDFGGIIEVIGNVFDTPELLDAAE